MLAGRRQGNLGCAQGFKAADSSEGSPPRFGKKETEHYDRRDARDAVRWTMTVTDWLPTLLLSTGLKSKRDKAVAHECIEWWTTI